MTLPLLMETALIHGLMKILLLHHLKMKTTVHTLQKRLQPNSLSRHTAKAMQQIRQRLFLFRSR